MKKIFVYVQHLLGIGHLHRTALITKSLVKSGYSVTLLSGGVAEPSLDFGEVELVQLPAIKSDAEFSDLYDEKGQPIDDQFKQSRKSKLLHAYTRLNPDGVLIETYPFGRRQMRFELLPLLNQIIHQGADRPWVASSIRDVIQPKSNIKRNQEIVDIVEKYFDIIFVHGDESFIKFEHTFPLAEKFKKKLVYTGYIVKKQTKIDSTQRDGKTILVSAGGGAVGKKLYETVINASQNPSSNVYKWHLLVGNNFSDSEFKQLQSSQNENLKVQRNRTDFLELLCTCFVSVSQAGYNTIMDLLVTKTPAVVVPFEGIAEQEQLIRANALAEKHVITVVREKELNAASLLKAIQYSVENSYQNININLHGGKQMVHFLKEKY